MSKFSDHLETALINATLRGIPYTSPPNVYLALFTADPTDANLTENEVSAEGTAYARQEVVFKEPVDGVTSNQGTVSFPTAALAWGTITHMGIYDAPTGGNLLYHGAVTPSHTVNAATKIEFPDGSIQVTLL